MAQVVSLPLSLRSLNTLNFSYTSCPCTSIQVTDKHSGRNELRKHCHLNRDCLSIHFLRSMTLLCQSTSRIFSVLECMDGVGSRIQVLILQARIVLKNCYRKINRTILLHHFQFGFRVRAGIVSAKHRRHIPP